VKDAVITREDGREKIKVGDSTMVMEGIGVERQVEMTEEDTMMVKVALQVIPNKTEMKGVKVHNIAVKVVQVEANVLEDILAEAKALGDITVVVEKRTVVEIVENKIYPLVDVVVKTRANEGRRILVYSFQSVIRKMGPS